MNLQTFETGTNQHVYLLPFINVIKYGFYQWTVVLYQGCFLLLTSHIIHRLNGSEDFAVEHFQLLFSLGRGKMAPQDQEVSLALKETR